MKERKSGRGCIHGGRSCITQYKAWLLDFRKLLGWVSYKATLVYRENGGTAPWVGPLDYRKELTLHQNHTSESVCVYHLYRSFSAHAYSNGCSRYDKQGRSTL